MQKKWIVKPEENEKVNDLQQHLKIDKILCQLLINRGIHQYEEAELFFRPKLEQLHSPFLMKDMEKACNRILAAIESNQKIMVYGDYDVDGTTAVSLVFNYLTSISANCIYYVPDRYTEGYGISKLGVEFASAESCSLIIALDCGIKAHEKIDLANQLGLDVIICDHHLPGAELPNAYAVLDPKRSDCEYPYKELCGCGIGFKLVQAMIELTDSDMNEAYKYLDLVAISIGSDIVPITGENRILMYYGLHKINSEPGKGVEELMDVAQVSKAMTVGDVVFKLGPRINAAGRLSHAKEAVQMFVDNDKNIRFEQAKLISERNTKRQKIDADITKEVIDRIDSDTVLQSAKTTVLVDEGWHKGVIGIVASRVMESYYRPTIICTESNGFYTGSARSVYGFDIHEALSKCAHLFENFGGHKYAAGITLKKENFSTFQSEFENIVSSSIDEDLLVPKINIDTEVQLKDLTEGFYNIIEQMAPFGPGNMRPVFMAKEVRSNQYARIVGSDHLKLDCFQNDCKIPAIAFSLGKFIDLVKTEPFDVCFSMDMNEWNGNRNLQLNIKDIRPTS